MERERERRGEKKREGREAREREREMMLNGTDHEDIRIM